MRTLVLTALLTLTLFSGCLSTDDSGISSNNGDNTGSTNQQSLKWVDPVALVCTTPTRSSCGSFGEPSLEVAGDGTIWYTAVDSIGASPPIWRSFDGGLTFQELPFADGTGVLRDATGIEGDFAIDDLGNVYFFDILAATTYFTKYEADGTHVFTLPQPQIPLVDRPWVRAGVEDEVMIFYNTGSATNFLRSENGGMIWDYVGMTTFPCGLAAMGQGPERNDIILAGCSNTPTAWISDNGGVSFDRKIVMALPDGVSGMSQYLQSSMDDSGRTYVPVHVELADEQQAILVYIIESDDTVRGPFTFSGVDGLVDKAWSVAGKDGVFAAAYYATHDVLPADEAEAEWYLEVAYTTDGFATAPKVTRVHADEDIVLTGVFGRSLGDFLEMRYTPEGDLAISYAKRDAGGLVNYFVRSEGMDFGPAEFRNGPSVA